MEFLANDRLRLRIRRSAHQAGRFEPPLPSPSGGRLDSSKKVRCRPRATRVSKWLPLTAKSIRQRQRSGGGNNPPAGGPQGLATGRRTHSAKGRGVLRLCRRAARLRGIPRPPRGLLPGFGQSARASPPSHHQIRASVPKRAASLPQRSRCHAHPPRGARKYRLNCLLSIVYRRSPQTKKQKKWDNLRQNETLIELIPFVSTT